MGAHSSKYALYIKKAFDTLDKNHDGKITVEELQETLRIPRAEILKGMEFIDKNKDGCIDYDEFCHLVEKRFLHDFGYLDKNRQGYITIEEMINTFRKMGKNEQDWEKFLQELDINKDGKVTLDEYIISCFRVLGLGLE